MIVIIFSGDIELINYWKVFSAMKLASKEDNHVFETVVENLHGMEKQLKKRHFTKSTRLFSNCVAE